MGVRGGDPPQGSSPHLREPRGKAAWERVIPASVTDLAALPEVLYTPDFAAFLRITPKALRQRAARGQVPAPFKLGKALAWTRGSVLAWLRDCGRSAGSTEMTITLRPYAHDKSRWHVDIRLMHPSESNRETRKRMVAPCAFEQGSGARVG